MTVEDWGRSIDQLADLGTRMVQFIGGEPTLHRGLPELVPQALDRGLSVEVFTNLVHIGPALWEVFSRPGVQLATSYYSGDAAQHEWTTANLVEAVRRSIPVRLSLT